MVLGGATISIKDHNDPEVLATHGHHKPEVALSDVLPREVSLHLTLCRSQPPSTTRLVQDIFSTGSTNAFRNFARAALSGFRNF